jgi:hypothetical protein
MADNLKFRRPYDAQKINLTQTYEQGWWLAKFGFRRTELPVLKRIIKAIGTNQADKIGCWIHENKQGIIQKWRDEYRMKGY